MTLNSLDGASYSPGKVTDLSGDIPGVRPQNKNSVPFCCTQEVHHGITNPQLSQDVGSAWFHGSEASLCTSDQMCPTPVLTQHSKREKIPLIFGTGISHLVLIDSRAGAQQEQGEGGALELFTHLPKEVTERSTWKRERENNENIP